jgi:hypothetical protein
VPGVGIPDAVNKEEILQNLRLFDGGSQINLMASEDLKVVAYAYDKVGRFALLAP